MRITIVGGGGFRTPLVYEALLDAAPDLAVGEVVLFDVEQARLERIEAVLRGLAAERGTSIPVRLSTEIDDAVEDADVVYCAIRVGGLPARVIDETVPLAEGVLGQETIGPGGVAFALRTVPVMLRVADAVARRAPHAWCVNFTNPVGLVTEAMQQVLGPRVIGICDSPRSLFRRVAAALGRPAGELWFDYVGLNHLGWLRSVSDGARDLLPGLLADDEALTSFEEGRLFGPAGLRSLGMIPNEYLYYYYRAPEVVAALAAAGQTRGQLLLEQQDRFYVGRGGPGEALRAWREARRSREASYMAEARGAAGLAPDAALPAAEGDDGAEEDDGYAGVAMELVRALRRNAGAVLVLNTANRGSVPFLDAEAVVEVPCVAGFGGAIPLVAGDVPSHARELMQRMKAVERTTIDAARKGSAELAERALAMHPVVPTREVARRILEAYRSRHPELRELLA